MVKENKRRKRKKRKVMSLTSKGRGFVVPLEANSEDKREQGVVFIRPMKDILSKEIGIYNHFMKIESIHRPTFTTLSTNPKDSIEHLTEGFPLSSFLFFFFFFFFFFLLFFLFFLFFLFSFSLVLFTCAFWLYE